jgi:PPOX class probable F420-dependent enzyme
MGELTPGLENLLDSQRVGVLATIAADGKPHQSVVYYARDSERLLISTEAGRLKARDVRRFGWASLSVRGEEQPYPSATFSGPAAIKTEQIGGPTAKVMQRIAGTDEPPQAQSDDALAEVGRVILELSIDRVSAVNYLD